MAIAYLKEKHNVIRPSEMVEEMKNLSIEDIQNLSVKLGFRKLGKLEAMQAQLTARGGAHKFIASERQSRCE